MELQNPSFGIVTDFYGINITLEEAILRLHKLGIRFLEIPEWHWTAGKEASYGEKFHPERVKTVRLLLEDLGMKACQLHSSAALAAQSEESRKLCVERIKVAIDLAAGLGCGALVIHIGGRHSVCKDLSDSAIFDANARSLAELVSYAKNTPVKLAIENLMNETHRMGCTISDLKDLIAETGSGQIGICMDTGHANVNAMNVPDAIRECGDLLIATHIQETCPGNDLHVFPMTLRRGKSTMNWFEIFEAFAQVNYANALIGECANNCGELPLDLADRYLESQKNMIESVLRGEFEL
jgi:sugar phosphate isomerase/epimerase